jgi:hypothetical protein
MEEKIKEGGLEGVVSFPCPHTLSQKTAVSPKNSRPHVFDIPYILESNAHPNLMRTQFLATSQTKKS